MVVVRLAGDHLYKKLLFPWLSLVMSLMASFCAVLFSHEMSWMRSGTYLSQFLRDFLLTLTYDAISTVQTTGTDVKYKITTL